MVSDLNIVVARCGRCAAARAFHVFDVDEKERDAEWIGEMVIDHLLLGNAITLEHAPVEISGQCQCEEKKNGKA